MKHPDLRRLWDGESFKYCDRPNCLSRFPLPKEYLPFPGERVFDAGCGTGNVMGMCREITPHIFGVDFSKSMVQSARRFGEVALGDIQRLPFQTGRFDYVINFLVMNHVADDYSAFSELARMARPGGRVIIVVPNKHSFLAALRAVSILVGRYSLGICHHYTLSTLRDQGKHFGLTLVRSFALPKRPTASSLLRLMLTWAGYLLDEVFRHFYPIWGGDIAVMFIKKEEVNG